MPGGRPHALNADYVAHWGNQNNRVKHLEKRFGGQGFIVYYRLRERLTTTDNHYLNFSGKLELVYFATDCWASVEEVTEILNVLAELEEIDPELWHEKRIVCSDPFLADISVAYKRRANQCPTINTIRQKFGLKPLYIEEAATAPHIPTLEQVLEYATENHASEKRLKQKATKFFNNYAAKGWKTGNNIIEDWTALLANWLQKDRETEEQKPTEKTAANDTANTHKKTNRASAETGERKNFAKG